MPENKSFLDSLAVSGQPESYAQETFQTVKNNSGRKKILVGVLIAILVAAGAFAYYYLTGTVKVPQLAGKSLDEANVWAQNNRIVLVAKSVYSFEDAENTVLSQDVEAGKIIKKKSTLPITVSLGPDPEEVIQVPDLQNMTTDQIESWINENKLTGTKVVTAASDVVEANHVISYTFTDGSEDNFKRKNRLTVTVSTGAEALSETVVMTDFSSMKPAAILQWGANNGVMVTLREEFDEYVAAGSVISQSVLKDTEIKRTDGVTVVISRGKAVTVPDLTAMSREETTTWAKLNNVTLTVLDKYSDTIPKGKLFDQSVHVGSSMKEGGMITVSSSLGRVDVASFIGKTKLDVLNWQNDVNGKGANIRLTFSVEYGDQGTYGKIIRQSPKNDYVNTGAEISVVVSNGLDKVEVPSFIGKTRLDVMDWQKGVNAENASIRLSFAEAYGDKGSAGKIISQSVLNDFIQPGTEIAIVISKGMKVAVPDFSGKTEAESKTIAGNAGLNILYDYQASDTVANGFVISQSPAKNTVISDAQPVSIVISVSDTPSDRVTVADFSNMRANAVQQWGIDNGVTIDLEEAYDNYVSAGSVISQSVPKNTVIKKTDPLTVRISAGKEPTSPSYVGVPNLSTMTKDEATAWAKMNNVSISFMDKYSNTYAKGTLFNQSPSAGSSVQAGGGVRVYYALGQVAIGNLVGKTKLEVLDWVGTVNDKGGNISIEWGPNKSGPVTAQELKDPADNSTKAIANDLIDVGSTMVFNLTAP